MKISVLNFSAGKFMKKIRKIIHTVLVIATLMFCLTACGGQGKDTSSQTQTETQTETQETLTSENEEQKSLGDKVKESEDTEMTDDNTTENSGSRVLVAYFSATGTTKKLAEYTAEITGADLYEIAPAEPYTDADLNYNDENSRTSIEMNDKSARPSIDGSVSDMEKYDIIFLGYAGGIIGLN